MVKRRSRTNTKYFQDIEDPDDPDDLEKEE